LANTAINAYQLALPVRTEPETKTGSTDDTSGTDGLLDINDIIDDGVDMSLWI